MTTSELTTIGPLQQALALATKAGDIDRLRDVAAMATALQTGAKARGLGVEAENQATEVIIRAERAMGSILRAIPRAVRTAQPVGEQSPLQQALIAIGEAKQGVRALIASSTAQRWQAIASLNDEEFERLLQLAHDKAERIAKVDFYRTARDSGKVPTASVRAVRDMLSNDDAPIPAYKAWCDATDALDLTQLPTEELADFATRLKTLIDAYQHERGRRAVNPL